MQYLTIIFGIVGLVVISVSIWIKKEKRQDIFFIFGGVCLLIYSIGIESWIFSILQVVFIASAMVELFKLKTKSRL